MKHNKTTSYKEHIGSCSGGWWAGRSRYAAQRAWKAVSHPSRALTASTRTRAELTARLAHAHAPVVQRLQRREARQTGRETRCAFCVDSIITAKREREREREREGG